MNKEINYSGFSAVPSDYECPDGSLAVSINLLPEDGALKPLLPPSEMFQLPGSVLGCYIHKNAGYTNFIFFYPQDNILHYACKGYDTPILSLEEGETHTDISSIGNTLVISTNRNLHFLLYRQDEGYACLGTELPEVKMQFALDAEIRTAEHTASLSFSDYQSAADSYTLVASASASGKMAQGESSAYSDKMDITLPTLEADTEYKFTAKGTWCTHCQLYGAEVKDGTYEHIAEIEVTSSLATTKAQFKTTKEYKYFRCQLIGDRNGGFINYSGKTATVTVSVYKGFTNAVSGKVIGYNSDNYNALFAAVNKFVMRNGTEDNRFVFPFFVRYALRLADGTHARISNPILLIPNSGYAPFINFSDSWNYVKLYAFFAKLQYSFLNSIGGEWKDIVDGVDVFASQQAYPYRQGDEFDATVNRFEYAFINSSVNQVKDTVYGYCRPSNSALTSSYIYNKYDLYSFANKLFKVGTIDDTTTEWKFVKIARNDGQVQDLHDTASFYLIHSFSLDEVFPTTDEFDGQTFRTLNVNGTLASLVTRQTLDDDALSQCKFYDARLVNYNSRLHLFDYRMRHPIPTAPAAQNGHLYRYYDNYGTLHSVHVCIRTTQGERIVASNINDGDPDSTGGTNIPWFFYPHNNAYMAILTFARSKQLSSSVSTTTTEYHTVSLNLKRHSFLNGAFWMAESLNEPDSFTFDGPTETAGTPAVNDTSDYPASVLQSQVASPFSFSAAMLNTLPVTRIYAMSSAAKALSQGQFGQFPLYAFTTEGVWALEVSGTGTYSARQPITRDVCTNPDGITQLDSAVLFPTDRGIMLISGSQTACISEAINSEYPFDATKLPGFTKLHAMLGHEPSTDKCLPTLPFTEFLKQCRMIYDYVHQRVIVYAPSITYAYVFSLKSKQWGMMFSDIASHLNSYPDALAVDSSNAVTNFSVPKKEQDGQPVQVKCLYATRPLKLEAANTLKTIDNIIQRGFFRKGNVATVLYGSRDLFNWHLVWSSKDHCLRGFRGSPYKYFRIAGVATLGADESIFGASVQFAPRQANRPR